MSYLLNLQKYKDGCYIADIFMGAFAYPDDIVILAPTKNARRVMLKIVITDFLVSMISSSI